MVLKLSVVLVLVWTVYETIFLSGAWKSIIDIITPIKSQISFKIDGI